MFHCQNKTLEGGMPNLIIKSQLETTSVEWYNILEDSPQEALRKWEGKIASFCKRGQND
jgi:hypothetical protein